MNTSVQAGHKARRLLGLGALAAALFLTPVLEGCGKDKSEARAAAEAAALAAAAAAEAAALADAADAVDNTGGDECNECGDYSIEPDENGYITDPRDGKRYFTVQIGSLVWMAENLNFAADVYGCVCYDENESNCKKYGRLYPQHTANKVCPVGWRLPSIQDWDLLFIAAGGSFDVDNRRWNAAGTKLKSRTGWKDKGNGTDDLGFSALPGGFHENGYGDTGFRLAGAGGYWWVSDEKYSYRAMGWDMSHVNENRLSVHYGLSVRCVRGHADPPAPGVGRPAPAAPQINAALPVGTPDTRWYKPKAKSFTISTADQLAGLAELTNGGKDFEGVTINLGSDIDLSTYGKGSAFNGGKGWIPISSGEVWFKGAFDGNGKKIRGLYINDPELTGAGLFSNFEGAMKNLGVVDVNITGSNSVGGITGYMARGAQVTDCYSTGAVNGADYVGGVVGSNNYRSGVTGSYSAAKVSGDHYVGGVAGDVDGAIVAGCYFTGTVRGATDVGGVAGFVRDESRITNCYSTGAVNGRAGRVGGVAGRINNSSVSNCYATGAINGREGTGGVAGSTVTGSRLTNCAALNPSVKGVRANTGRVIGYVQGTYGDLYDTLSNNAAFTNLKDGDGKADKWTDKGEGNGDGEDITAERITADGTIGGRFTDDVWTTENGKLPGLGGKTVEMPEHLK